MIPLVEETVISYGWLTETQFFNFIGVCESTPGPIAVNMATYVGSTQGGLIGSICATLGVVTPSFIIILLIASILKNFTENKYFKGFLKGVKPVITALILSTGVILLSNAVGFATINVFEIDVASILIFSLLVAIYFVSKLVFKKKLSAVTMIIISALLGIAIYTI